ncbi:MAG TPA: PilZ domain-containing protein [Xanthobacteraceae bacterium]|nr:PilZ domain-containing protein [Xanthobacteraceae bacterium]
MGEAAERARNSANQRRKPRRTLRYKARILIDKKGTQIPCSLSDVSETGARVKLESESELPEQFVLLLTPTGSSRRLCRLAWRDGTAVGVAFTDPVATKIKFR